MTIALDYDDTYTADPALLDRFIGDAKRSGHRVIIATCRRDTEENREDIGKPAGCLVLFSNLGSKRQMFERLGWKVDVWIDDDPECIWHGK